MGAKPLETREILQEMTARNEYKGIKFRSLAPGITTHPLIRGGRPCIAGTGLKVTSIVIQQQNWQQSPTEIARHFDVDLAQVKDALDYYAAHSDYIDTDIALANHNHEQLEEADDSSFRDILLARRGAVT